MDYFQDSLEANTDLKSTLLRARLIRLMQAATNPALLRRPIDEYYQEQGLSNDIFIDDAALMEKIVNYSTIEVPEKYRVVEELIRDIIDRGERVVVWGIFIQNIKELQDHLTTQGISSKLLIGETPVESDQLIEGIDTREGIVREFNSPASSFNVVIANPFAVAESISLHKACHNAIYMERNFNAANFLQSKDRIHRVGLSPTDKINYYYVLSYNSIDGTIHERLIQKERRMQRIIESKSIPLIDMNMDYQSNVENDDLKALILDYVGRASKDR